MSFALSWSIRVLFSCWSLTLLVFLSLRWRWTGPVSFSSGRHVFLIVHYQPVLKDQLEMSRIFKILGWPGLSENTLSFIHLPRFTCLPALHCHLDPRTKLLLLIPLLNQVRTLRAIQKFIFCISLATNFNRLLVSITFPEPWTPALYLLFVLKLVW